MIIARMFYESNMAPTKNSFISDSAGAHGDHALWWKPLRTQSVLQHGSHGDRGSQVGIG
jgi:hypothetical protein